VNDRTEGKTGRRDPCMVRVEEAVIVVTTDCCHKPMPLAKQRITLNQPRPLSCFWCARRRQLLLITDPTAGLRAVWSDLPDKHRRRWRRWWAR
jgi:hypothetical protein